MKYKLLITPLIFLSILSLAFGTISITIPSGSGGSGGSTSPEGIDGSVQYNDGGVFGGKSTFIFNSSLNQLLLGNLTTNPYFEVFGQPSFSTFYPRLFFNTTSGTFAAGMNVVAEPSSAFGSAVALGSSLDSSAPAYTVEATGDYTFAVHGRAKKDYAISLGGFSIANGTSSVAIGGTDSTLTKGSKAYGDEAISIGYDAVTFPDRSVAIGGQVVSNGSSFSYGTVSIGYRINNDQGTAMGKRIEQQNGASSVSIGSNLDTNGANSVNVGNNNDINSYGVYGGAGDGYSSTLGSFNSVNGSTSHVIGTGGRVTNNDAIVIGISDLPVGKTNVVANNLSNTILLGFNINTTQYDVLDISSFNGVKIGSRTGESITMDGDDLYVAGNNEIDGFLVIGNNTETGLTNGDINASTIYYDVLVAKSPIVMCSRDILKCFVMDVENEKEYYIQIDKNYNIISSKTKDNKIEPLTQKITNKLSKLNKKSIQDENKKVFKNDCLLNGGEQMGDECIKTTITEVTYEQAVESYQKPIYNYITVIKKSLDENLQEVNHEVREKGEIISYETKTRFKENCYWENDAGYICQSKQVIGVFQ